MTLVPRSLALLGASIGCLWLSPAAVAAPEARFNHAMCFDRAGGHTLMFGGRSGGRATEVEATLWAWDGERWKALASDGPTRRSAPVLVCVPGDSSALLYGGYARTSIADTWIWRRNAWVRADSGAFPARAHAAAAYDPVRRTVLLFGGFLDGARAPTAETFEWNGREWRKLDVVGPGARYAHAMTTDLAGRRILLHGGMSGFGDDNQVLGDTWSWDGTSWSKLADDGPAVAADRSLQTSARGSTTVIGGGAAVGFGLWDLTGSAWRQRDSDSLPLGRVGHASAHDDARGATVMFGGRIESTGQASGETWEVSASGWRLVAPK